MTSEEWRDALIDSWADDLWGTPEEVPRRD